MAIRLSVYRPEIAEAAADIEVGNGDCYCVEILGPKKQNQYIVITCDDEPGGKMHILDQVELDQVEVESSDSDDDLISFEQDLLDEAHEVPLHHLREGCLFGEKDESGLFLLMLEQVSQKAITPAQT